MGVTAHRLVGNDPGRGGATHHAWPGTRAVEIGTDRTDPIGIDRIAT
jgi:hypothetical protein